MNYILQDIPNTGTDSSVIFNIVSNDKPLGNIRILLLRDAFPAGVENFYHIAKGNTYKIEEKGFGQSKFAKKTDRSYHDTKFFKLKHNQYIMGGDIYNNNGTGYGTIYDDKLISECFLGEYYYPFDTKYLVALVPIKINGTNETFYDSTFIITLDTPYNNEKLRFLDDGYIVIGTVVQGTDILDKLNTMITPFAGRKYPTIKINKSNATRGKYPHDKKNI